MVYSGVSGGVCIQARRQVERRVKKVIRQHKGFFSLERLLRCESDTLSSWIKECVRILQQSGAYEVYSITRVAKATQSST